jgi:CHASE3 domain sensor protein
MQLQPLRAMQFGFGVALAVLLGVGAVAYRSVIAANESTQWTQHTQDVLEHLARLGAAIASVESGYRQSIDSFWLSVVKLPRGTAS